MAKIVVPDRKKLCGKRTLKFVIPTACNPFDKDAEGIAFGIDDFMVAFFCDPNDGYRSSCLAPWFAPDDNYMGSRTHLYSFGADGKRVVGIPVIIKDTSGYDHRSSGEWDGITFYDARNNLVVANVGTANTDDYYPSFTAEWMPDYIFENTDAGIAAQKERALAAERERQERYQRSLEAGTAVKLTARSGRSKA